MENVLPSTPASKSNRRSSVLMPDTILQDRYRIVRQLGKGGMGAVYEAVDQRLDAVVALKETFSVDDRLRRQFEQEARLLAQLNHSALPRVSDYFTKGGRAFLVMQFIAGADLAEIIATHPGPFPRNQVITWADQLLDALIYLHTQKRQIIHRDIKPHNLKVTSTGQIALLDFGLAKAQSADLSSSSSSTSIFGYTRRYSPLEQIQDQGTTPQSDIYALGATLYHLLTGVKPQDALARAAALANSKSDPLKPANEIHGAVGLEIAAILSRAMALSPEDRYPTASEFRGALSRVGRRETLAPKKSARTSIDESATDATVKATVVRRERLAMIDPFDSYSILKPNDVNWLVPIQRGHPGVIAFVLVIFLTGGLGIFFGFGHWIDSADSVLNYARANSRTETGTLQSKSEKSRFSASGVVSIPAVSAVEVSRKNDVQKHRALLPEIKRPDNKRPDGKRSKPTTVTPPPFSIAP
jgi:serine/threonine protein kinase